MTVINRQQYMSELSKLLTFMFKEDRSEILKQYNDMLDNADDEQALLESFGSPTRLAVAISRNYQRDERKLSVHADSKDGDKNEVSKVRPVIPTPAKNASQPVLKPREPDESSYIDIIEEIRREKAAEEGVEYKPIFFKDEKKPEPEPEPEPGVGEAPVEEPETAPEAPVEPAQEMPKEETDKEEASAQETEGVEETADEAAEAPEESEEAAEEETPAEETSAEEAPVEAAPAEEAGETDIVVEIEELPADAAEEEREVRTVKKTRIFPLILYVIVSVPIGLVLLLLMLGIELSIFGVGLLGLKVGFELLAFTFSGMQVFADVLICLGVTLGVLALGVLVTWLGIWLIIVSVPGLIRGIIKLGKKLCVKEVEIDD